MIVQWRNLESVEIRNFRAFKELSIHKLGRINLIAGKNNSGKTSLLEALFLLAGGGRPDFALNSNVLRAQNDQLRGPAETLSETYWKPLFNGLKSDNVIEISAQHSQKGYLSLSIAMERSKVVTIPFDHPIGDKKGSHLNDLTSLLTFSEGDKGPIQGRATIGEGINIEIIDEGASRSFEATILLPGLTHHQDDALRLARLRKQKQGQLILDALQMIEPQLVNIEDNSSSGFPMIWGDLGLAELVPLAMMGEGMTQLARIVLAIANVPGGLLLVDEVETGLHHSVLPRVWRTIDAAATQFGTQVVATTHSFECIRAAHEALSKCDGLYLHRLEVTENISRCVTYEPEELEAAIKHDLEVR